MSDTIARWWRLAVLVASLSNMLSLAFYQRMQREQDVMNNKYLSIAFFSRCGA